MRALRNFAERDLRIVEVDEPPAPGDDEIQVRICAVALNHIDVWGWRGMAFAKRELPVTVGAEASAEIIALGKNVADLKVGQLGALYGANTCGICKPCIEGRDNFCENVNGIFGFHIDGFAQEKMNFPARLFVPAPDGVDAVAAACTPVTFGTVEHMLFDNAKLQPGETILVQAGGSGIGTAAIQLAKAIGCEVITTVGSDEKARQALDLGADYAINYQTDRFEGRVRKLTKKRGVDVVFEHVGVDTWEGSMFCLKMGGRLVTCGSTTGIKAEINLFQLFQRQLRLLGSFGCSLRNIRNALDKLAQGVVHPVVDLEIPLEDIAKGLERLENRQVFGKIIVTF
ncbi:MAG: zinc-binding dehydrogenase [Fimbriimonadaceae bacterium]|nr:zinc-binding dehydrogenase [Alphaproteobacteria bacterium]